MCGIAGILSLDGKVTRADEVEAMCAALLHRGPDEAGFHVEPHVALGMRRLRIIDLETGHQPVRNEDGSVRVVLNGEIYNFAALRSELEARGHRFYTSSDTEVIVHLYEDLGPRCVERLRGMFAFALWDARARELLVARDRLGKKPLYYAQLAGRLVFASELKALLQLPELEPRLNWRAVTRLFTFLSTPAAESILEGVYKLEPGHLMRASAERGVRIERYWSCEFAPDRGRSEEYFVEGIRERLDESVKLRLTSDVPIGAFLSGGIDSSAVVASMARQSTSRVRTFSIGFADPGFDELPYARMVANQFGTEHHELVLEPDAVAVVQDLAWYLDEPFGDSSAIPTYLVSKLAAEHVTVLLSGDGGDEIFAGYERYAVEERERRFRLIPAPAKALLRRLAERMPDGMRGRRFLRHVALPDPERYLDGSTLFGLDDRSRLFTPAALEQMAGYDPWRDAAEALCRPGEDWLTALQRFDLNAYLPLDILTKVDRMSMAHSIEARAPLLDHELVEFAATIPPELKLRRGATKHIFKRAMRGILPDAIIDRPKHGFAVPLARWFRGELGGFVRDLLLSRTAAERGIVEPAAVERLIASHEAGRDLDLHLWTLISFELWCRLFLDGRRAGRSAPVSAQVERLAPPVYSGAARASFEEGPCQAIASSS
jgi:asparagine synthase (glutamine-hydrolysing)